MRLESYLITPTYRILVESKIKILSDTCIYWVIHNYLLEIELLSLLMLVLLGEVVDHLGEEGFRDYHICLVTLKKLLINSAKSEEVE